jgi:hypothetical protein
MIIHVIAAVVVAKNLLVIRVAAIATATFSNIDE